MPLFYPTQAGKSSKDVVTVTVNEVPKPNNFLSENEKLAQQLQRIQAGEVQAQALRMLKEAERLRKIEEARGEKEQRQLIMIESKRRKQEEIQRNKQEEAVRRLQEKEAKRQQAAMVREQVSHILVLMTLFLMDL